MLTIEIAARVTAILVGIGMLQNSLELLSGSRQFITGGLFDWNSRRILSSSPGAVRGSMVGRTGAVWLRSAVIVRIVCSAALIIPLQSNLLYGIYAIGILLSSFFLAYQIRYGKDGSNQISIIVLAGLAFTFLMPTTSPFHPVGLYFIAAQAVLSYFAAGVSKISSAPWRQGSAMRSILNTATYGQSTVASLITGRPWIGGSVGWSVIIVEIIFPVALIAPPGVLVALLIAGALLHLGTVALIGLDTFFWAFTATFPAIILANGALLGG